MGNAPKQKNRAITLALFREAQFRDGIFIRRVKPTVFISKVLQYFIRFCLNKGKVIQQDSGNYKSRAITLAMFMGGTIWGCHF